MVVRVCRWVWVDGCEVRPCDPCARVRPCVPVCAVSRFCPARFPPVSFYRYCTCVRFAAACWRLRVSREISSSTPPSPAPLHALRSTRVLTSECQITEIPHSAGRKCFGNTFSKSRRGPTCCTCSVPLCHGLRDHLASPAHRELKQHPLQRARSQSFQDSPRALSAKPPPPLGM